MTGILRIKDANGVWHDITAIRGEQGPAGIDGKDYILTEADKAEIAGMVEVSGGDLSDYYTKEEINNLLANLPTGDIPSGEEVEF